MKLSKPVLQRLVVRLDLSSYVRIIPSIYASSPLGMGFGGGRFSSPRDAFKVLYLAENSRTAIAERILRDRFEGSSNRELLAAELLGFSAVAVRNDDPLVLVDLRHEGAHLLGVTTDAVRAKDQSTGRLFSQDLHDQTSLDGIVYMSRITNRECVAVYDRAVTRKLSVDAHPIPVARLASLTADLAALHVSLIR